MTTPTNAELAQEVTEILTRWNSMFAEFQGWLSGSASGGPNSDGRYPLTDAFGNTELYACIALLSDQTEGVAASAQSSALAADASAVSAGVQSSAAEAAAAQALAHRDAAYAARDEALTYRDDAAANWAATNAAIATITQDYVERVSPPASSSAAGETGQIASDADYFYVCVSPNTWKRAALSSW